MTASVANRRHCRRCWPALPLVALVPLFLLWCSALCAAAHSGGGGTPVPVVVSTVYRFIPNVADIATDSAGNSLLLSSGNGGVYRGFANGTTQLIVANIDDGMYGITCDAAINVVYVTSYTNHRIRKVDLNTVTVNAFAGGVQGNADGVGPAARFDFPFGIVHYAPSGLLYVADFGNGFVRRIVVATALVSTVAAAARCDYLCLTADGTSLYATSYTTVVMINTRTSAAATILAGTATPGYRDGVGAAALFAATYGIALTSDESSLIIADRDNVRIRRLELSTRNVTTIAGNGTLGWTDGPGLSATFRGSYGVRWHCNQPSMLCGVLVADFVNNTVRFVAVEGLTATAALTGSSSHSIRSASMHPSQSGTRSNAAHVDSLSLSVGASRSLSGSSKKSTATTVVTMSRTKRFPLTASRTSTLTKSFTFTSAASQHSSLMPSTQTASPTQSGPLDSESTSPAMHSCAPVLGAALHPLDGINVYSVAPSVIALVGASAVNNVDGGGMIVAEPVGRRALHEGYPIAAAISLTLGAAVRGLDGGSVAASVLLDVVTTDAHTFLTSAVVITVLSSRVSGREQLIVCLLYPIPNVTESPRWLPLTVGVFRDVMLRFSLTLLCPTDGTVSSRVVVSVPSPGHVAMVVAEVKAVGLTAEYASLVAFPTVGSAVGRLAALRSLVLCNEDVTVVGMLPLHVTTECEDGVVGLTNAADARGAVLGNLLLWSAGALLMVLLTCCVPPLRCLACHHQYFRWLLRLCRRSRPRPLCCCGHRAQWTWRSHRLVL